MASVFVPVLYTGVLIISLGLFSRIYRRRFMAAKQLEPWFPSHPERDVYITLLQQTDPPAAEQLLKAALLRRAMTDVSRLFRIRDDKQALQTLVQKGSVGDDLWNACLAAEKELEAEIVEVVGEANTYVPGWGQIIFSTASEMVVNEKTVESFYKIRGMRAEIASKYGSSKTTSESAAVQEAQSTLPAPSATKATAAPLTGLVASEASTSKSSLAPPQQSTHAVEASSDAESSHTPSKAAGKSPKKNKKKK